MSAVPRPHVQTVSALLPTCVTVCKVGSDDLLFAAVWKLLEPGDLNHFLFILHLVSTGQPGLTFCQGALGRDELRRLHKDALRTHH